MSSVSVAFINTALAGLATMLGAVIVFLSDSDNKKFLSAALGFSAGVMIYISFMEMLPMATENFMKTMSEKSSGIAMLASFFGSMLVFGLISHLVPEADEPHEIKTDEEIEEEAEEVQREHLEKVGLKSAIAIGVHNFPEGMVTFMTTLLDPAMGVSIAIAIAMHNIPEGIGVAAPIFFATGDKKRATWLTFLSGVSEPLGAILAYLILRPFLTTTLFGIVFAAISGIMVLISFDELLPASRAYGETHMSLLGVLFGMLVMGVSLIML
ncbi:MAG: zinc transporter ZupT [Peptoniphilus sp.]|nr:zinc transporter ZupT [Peptoniphilus sp.]MDD7363248.1 zinc transporter ZupT [Bacillota bacterium]MDY6045341.1 zinc transporter ZupT [Peptoniphilus sp.]